VDERGFGAQLAHLFQRRLDIVNRGFSGIPLHIADDIFLGLYRSD